MCWIIYLSETNFFLIYTIKKTVAPEKKFSNLQTKRYNNQVYNVRTYNDNEKGGTKTKRRLI